VITKYLSGRAARAFASMVTMPAFHAASADAALVGAAVAVQSTFPLLSQEMVSETSS